ncbi:MAG: HAMP domain-containing histidine kinase, partial [Erysipelothrix sp.]|nr:HAMP domain-containing histidine kinase [Erysipelothrix sp.]
MQQKQNKIIALLFAVVSILLVLLNDRLEFQIALVITGLILLVLVNRFFAKKSAEENENLIVRVKDKAKKQHAETEDKMGQLIASIPSALVYINQRGEFDVSNKNFDAILGVPALNVYDSSIETEFRQMLLDAFLNEKQFIRQENFNGVDYQILSIPMIKKGRYNGCMIILQDITRLLEGEKMQKRFVADASHELKTPISSIKGMSEILNRTDFDDEETRLEFLARIQIESARLEQLVEDLILQSKLTENKLHLEKTEFNLKQFFDGIIYEKRRELHNANIQAVLNCPSDVMILADHFRLSQVFINLFNNAINYASNESIKINCNISTKVWEIEFCDTGAGMDDAI